MAADINTTSERIIPTNNIVQIIHPKIPSIDKKVQVDASIESQKSFEIFHEPTDLSTKAPIEFIIHPTVNNYVDLSSFNIDIKLKMYKRVAGTLTRLNRDTWQSYFINNISQSLWSVIKVYLNDVNVQSSYDNQQVSNMRHILTTSNELVDRRGILQGAFKVEKGTLDAEVTDELLAHDSIQKRIDFSKDDTLHIRGPLILDLASCDKFLLDNVTIKIVLEPSAAPFFINAKNDAGPFDYQIESCKLQVTKIRPSDGALLATANKLIQTPCEYLMTRNTIHREILPANLHEITITRPFTALIPDKIYCFFVDREASNGSHQRPPYYYPHLNLEHYSFKINGQEIAGGSENSSYVTLYDESLKAHDQEHFIPYENYINGSFVMCVNTNLHSDANSLHLDRFGNLTISFSFKEPLARQTTVYLVGVIDSTFEIDSDRTVTTQFQY